MKSLASVIPGTPIEDCRYLLSMKCQETILKTAEPSVIKSMASCLTIHSISRLALESVQVRYVMAWNAHLLLDPLFSHRWVFNYSRLRGRCCLYQHSRKARFPLPVSTWLHWRWQKQWQFMHWWDLCWVQNIEETQLIKPLCACARVMVVWSVCLFPP